jgi:hypothetical protein
MTNGLMTRAIATRFAAMTALLVLSGSPAAMAQMTNNPNSPSASKPAPSREAPVGHRQPRVDEVPSEKNLGGDPNDPISKEDALLDRKMKSICRGC